MIFAPKKFLFSKADLTHNAKNTISRNL